MSSSQHFCCAVHFLRGGAGFGTPVHDVKCLQIALSGCNPGKSANEEGLVQVYGLPFNVKPPEAYQARKLHPVVGKLSGLYLSADSGPHEAERGPKRRAMFGGLETCKELPGFNLNPHKQHRAKKDEYLSSLNVMGCDSFAFMVSLVNGLENQSINRRSLDHLVEKKKDHPKLHKELCKGRVWKCGRCFCSTPLMRSLDRFGIFGRRGGDVRLTTSCTTNDCFLLGGLPGGQHFLVGIKTARGDESPAGNKHPPPAVIPLDDIALCRRHSIPPK